jgi:hypothetical protein
MDADGGNDRAVTSERRGELRAVLPASGRPAEIIFSSNMDDPKRREFDLYLIRDDGTGLDAGDPQPRLRRVPDADARREADRLGVQPQRHEAARDERLRGGLGWKDGR